MSKIDLLQSQNIKDHSLSKSLVILQTSLPLILIRNIIIRQNFLRISVRSRTTQKFCNMLTKSIIEKWRSFVNRRVDLAKLVPRWIMLINNTYRSNVSAHNHIIKLSNLSPDMKVEQIQRMQAQNHWQVYHQVMS